MYIFSFIKNNAVKSLAAASILALLSFLLVWVIYNFKSPYSNTQTEVSLPGAAQIKPRPADATSSNDDSASTNDIQATLQFLNPDAPCPSQQYSCMAKQNDNIKDQSCPSYKPIWAYFSKDNGVSWLQVGCYATEIDATKALNKAITTGYVKNNKSMNANNSAVKSDGENNSVANPSNTAPTPPSTGSKSIQDIFNNPYNKPADSEKKSDNSDRSRPLAEPINSEQKTDNKKEQQTNSASNGEVRPSQSANNETGVVDAEKENRDERHQNLTVRFKLLFGLIPVEKRTYPNEEMREKALYLWKKEQKLLEPDGTINEKYAIKNHNDDAIMHHH